MGEENLPLTINHFAELNPCPNWSKMTFYHVFSDKSSANTIEFLALRECYAIPREFLREFFVNLFLRNSSYFCTWDSS